MNSPNNAAVLRTLIIYAVCVPLAIVIGYLLTNPMDYSTFGLFGIVALVLISPLLLRWHHPLLVLSWNMGMTVFFLKGAPSLWIVMAALSLVISIMERMISSDMHFIRVPQLTWPLLCLTAVVLMTAKLTGGFGLRTFGSDIYGGKKYVFLLVGIASYFALTARRIPPERVGVYVALFLLGGLTNFIGDLYPIMPSGLNFIFWLFPPQTPQQSFEIGTSRLLGFTTAAGAIYYYLMARYGIRGIFLEGKPWRLVATVALLAISFLGGFRHVLLSAMLVFLVQFYLEGLHRTKLLPVLVGAGVLLTILVIPFASRLPFAIQRTMAFLPLPLDPAVKMSAEGSSEWRINMWTALLPQIPQHLLLGKGLAITPEDYNEMMGTTMGMAAGAIDPSQDPMAIAYDYHSGPLSVIISFGIWGAITVLWLLAAGFWVMLRNYRYGDPSLRVLNAFLLAVYVVHILSFMIIFGGITGDIAGFVGYFGLSVALNNGVCQPVPEPVPVKEMFLRPRGGLPRPQPRPAFPR